MTRSRIIVVLLFLVAFGAGLSVGKVFSHQPHMPSERGPSWLSSELNLTEPQREQMLAIWGNIYKAGSDERNERRALSKQKNDAIANLIPEAQKAELAKISDDYDQQIDSLMSRGKERYEQAIKETKKILTQEQRQKYEEILSRREQQRRRGGSGREGRNGREGRGGSETPEGRNQREAVPSPQPEVGQPTPAKQSDVVPKTESTVSDTD